MRKLKCNGFTLGFGDGLWWVWLGNNTISAQPLVSDLGLALQQARNLYNAGAI